MKHPAQGGEPFWDRLRALRLEFDAALQAFEQNNPEASLHHAHAVESQLHSIINALAANYHTALHNRLEFWEKNRAIIDKLIASKAPPDMDAYITYLSSLDRALSIIKNELSRNYPKPSRLGLFFKNNKKVLSLVGGAVVLITGTIFGLRTIAMRHRGIVGYYYSDTELTSVKLKRLDREINFDWGLESPIPKWRKDDFSIRWTGFLKVPADGTYEFSTESDDGVRLRIDRKTIIDNWSVHRLMTDKGQATLTAGPHMIELEYYENKRRAAIKLYWRRENDSKARIISSSYLAPVLKYAK